jgi:hypothetical protein
MLQTTNVLLLLLLLLPLTINVLLLLLLLLSARSNDVAMLFWARSESMSLWTRSEPPF